MTIIIVSVQKTNLSRRMGKPIICIGENKGADQLCSNCEADQRLCFRYAVSTIPLLSKSIMSSLYNHLLRLYSPVCVGPGRNPNCWFSHIHAHFLPSERKKNSDLFIFLTSLLVASCHFGKRSDVTNCCIERTKRRKALRQSVHACNSRLASTLGAIGKQYRV